MAIKRFKQPEDEDEDSRRIMRREIKVLHEFKHRNIVHLTNVFREYGRLFLVFEYQERTLLEELQFCEDG